MKTYFTRRQLVGLACLLFVGAYCTQAQNAQGPAQRRITTIWDGVSWSNGVPDANAKAVFAADYNADQTLTASDVEVGSGANVTFLKGGHLIVTDSVNVSPTGKLTFRIGANLSQHNPNIVNNTLSIFDRDTPLITKYDFVYWSSPVSSQNLYSFSSGTLSDKFFKYSPANGWESVDATITDMEVGKGYAIRGPQNYNSLQSFTGSFSGSANNGNITTPIASGSNFIGNPYGDALSADCFILNSTNQGLFKGHLLFWSHNIPVDFSGATPGTASYNYNVNDYAVYNLLGGVGTGVTLDTSNAVSVNRPNGYVASGQGFFVDGFSIGSAQFNNGMRESDDAYNMQFFRASQSSSTTTTGPNCSVTRHRIWVRLTQGTNFRETLIGYAPSATTSTTIDSNYDVAAFTTGTFDINSKATSSSSQNLTIQGRALASPFDTADVIPLTFTALSGSTKISATDFDGLFATQNFWLRETIGTTVNYIDIRTSDYTFNSNGTANDTRFAIVFALPPTTIVYSNYCFSNISSRWTVMYANQVAGATAYHFRLTETTNTSNVRECTNTASNCQLANFPGTTTPGTSYLLEVATYQVGGQWQYGSSCTITTTSSYTRMSALNLNPGSKEFSAKVYPNPTDSNFRLDLETSFQEGDITITIYDMLGRTVEASVLSVYEVNEVDFGSTLKSGVYNIVVKQGENIQTLRVIKR